MSRKEAEHFAELTIEKFSKSGIYDFGTYIYGSADYPQKLRDAKNPPELVYYQGTWDLLFFPKLVAVVGTRNPTGEGKSRARRLVQALVRDGVTIVSGLAKGIDKIAHKTCLDEGGNTIGILGTPLTRTYPSQHRELQAHIAKEHLLVSQVPVNRYEMQVNPTHNRHFFPERNNVMSALTDATIIVEAGETSGTLVQAKAAIEQGRLLFILDSCFQNVDINWPRKFEKLGAIRVRDYDDIRHRLFPAQTQ